MGGSWAIHSGDSETAIFKKRLDDLRTKTSSCLITNGQVALSVSPVTHPYDRNVIDKHCTGLC